MVLSLQKCCVFFHSDLEHKRNEKIAHWTNHIIFFCLRTDYYLHDLLTFIAQLSLSHTHMSKQADGSHS